MDLPIPELSQEAFTLRVFDAHDTADIVVSLCQPLPIATPITLPLFKDMKDLLEPMFIYEDTANPSSHPPSPHSESDPVSCTSNLELDSLSNTPDSISYTPDLVSNMPHPAPSDTSETHSPDISPVPPPYSVIISDDSDIIDLTQD